MAGHWARSLRLRLLAATLVAVLVAMVLAGVLLAGLFRDHVLRQFGSALTAQLDQVTARLEFDAAGQPQVAAAGLSDPRWSRPYGGLYWQVDAATAAPQRGVLRSRSLWDAVLTLPSDELPDGQVHLHELPGPDGQPVLVVERSITRGDAPGAAWRLIVAGDLAEAQAAVQRLNRMLAASLAALLVLLCAAALAQVAIGLAPLRALQRALVAVQAGQSARLEGRFPTEVQPLVDDFNAVLQRHGEVVARSRTQAGNLAHAIKTPLAVLAQAAVGARRAPATLDALPPLIDEQVALARRQVDWHLARARAAAALGMPGAHVALQPAVDGLLRVMRQVHADRALDIQAQPWPAALAFAGEEQDLQEMLGNVLDNACQWARHSVRIAAAPKPGSDRPRLCITVDDDGPGIAADRRERVLARGERLDESVPGSGLGLAIVHELAGLYGGTLQLLAAPAGGLRVQIELPAA